MKFISTSVLVLFLLSSFMVGCGPSHKIYFKPQATRGTIVKETCGGQAGASNGILFEEKLVTLWFTMAIHNPMLLVEIYIKEPTQIIFAPTKFVLTSTGEKKNLQLEKIQVIEDVKVANSPKKDFPIQDIIHLKGKPNAVYYLWFPSPLENELKLSLTVAPLLINEESISLPTIHWAQVEESFFLEKIFLWNC